MKHWAIPQRFIDQAVEDLGNHQRDLTLIEGKVEFHLNNADNYRSLVEAHKAHAVELRAFLKLAGVSDDDLLKEVGDDSEG